MIQIIMNSIEELKLEVRTLWASGKQIAAFEAQGRLNNLYAALNDELKKQNLDRRLYK